MKQNYFTNYLCRKLIYDRDQIRRVVRAAFGFGLFISLFLVLYKPFQLYELSGHFNNLKIIGYGPITTIVILINYYLIPKLTPKLFIDWKIYKEIIYSVYNIALIAVGNWTYTFIIAGETYDKPTLAEFILITLAVGIFPMTVFGLLHERKALRDNLDSVQLLTRLNNHEDADVSDSNIIELNSDTRKSIAIPFGDFICIESLGNYCTVYYRKENEIKKEVIRKSLKSIENQVEAFEQIKRCHKSYIVNLKNVEAVSGNAKGYKLKFTNLNFSIPVSRNFPISMIESIM
jgi:hypothetical protein